MERLPTESLQVVPMLDKHKLSAFVNTYFPSKSTWLGQSQSHSHSHHAATVETNKESNKESVVVSIAGNLTTLKRSSMRHEVILLQSTSLHSEKFNQTDKNPNKGTFNEIKHKVLSQFKTMKTLTPESAMLRTELEGLFENIEQEISNNKLEIAYSYLKKIREFPDIKQLQEEDLEFYKKMLQDHKALIIELDKALH